MSKVSFAIIGCGLIGKKRAAALDPSQIKIVCDLNLSAAQNLAKTLPGCEVTTDPSHAIQSNIDAVIVATANASLGPLALQAVRAGKHVIMEKPGAIHSTELRQIGREAEKTGALVRIGYNHRFHPALTKAHEMVTRGELGELMMIRGRYGHGARKGYDREWRADPKLSGGGELIDQGVHMIDLAAWFMGDFSKIDGHAATLFWDMPVDDNAFISLRTSKEQTAWLQVSCTEWKNLFSFEIYGKTGKLHIEGLGGSYGVERLSYYKMLPEMGPPDTFIFEYPRGDQSWKTETQLFCEEIANRKTPSPGWKEGARTLEIVEEIYRLSGKTFAQPVT